MMQTFKYASINPTDENLTNAESTLNDAGVQERAAVTYFFQATSQMASVQKSYSDEAADRAVHNNI